MTSTPSLPVLVVGGSLVGLSTALFLAWQGVPTVLVEKHPGSSPHPRAIGYTARTMELLRAVGLGAQVPDAPADFKLLRARIESLAGTWFEQSGWTPKPAATGRPPVEYSPCRGAAIAQDRLEPILRAQAIALGADIRLSTELIGFEQDADGVTATLRPRDGGADHTLRAAYLVAADGARSPVREALGIGRQGRGPMRTLRSVLFRAPLESYLAKGVSQFEIDQPGFKAFLTTYHDGRWVLMFDDDLERDEAALTAAVHRATGRPDLPVDILATGRWALEALVADRFSQGRVFLAGDAAHSLPPSRGGFGANTGIQDAHNLAWKLAAVLAGTSSAALLDTYSAERRPVAWLRHQQIFARPDYRAESQGVADGEPILNDQAIEFGQLYRSAAVPGANEALPAALRPDEWAGQPGTRAPHLWVRQDGERVSTLDLFQPGWVLLAEDAGWRDAAAQASSALGIGLRCMLMGVDVLADDLAAFRGAFGISARGASLVRPDGYVAWRAVEGPAEAAALTVTLARVASARQAVQQSTHTPGEASSQQPG